MEENREYSCMKGIGNDEVCVCDKRNELFRANAKQVN